MDLVERIKLLCNERKVTIAEVERVTGISNGQIRRWNTSSPKIDNIKKVADYFDVSTDYLLGRTEQRKYYDLTEKDERDIQKELQRLIDEMSNNSSYAAFDGAAYSDLDEEDRELLKMSLENSLRLAKRLAKQKFTPKKHR